MPSAGKPDTTGSNASTIRFSEPNGTYTYTIGAVSGYSITNGSTTGSVTVSGGNPPKTITTVWATATSASAFRLSTLDYLVIGVVVFLVVIGLVVLLRRGRRSPPPASSAFPSETGVNAPPSPINSVEQGAPPPPPSDPGPGPPPVAP